jgi:hypothetical protein
MPINMKTPYLYNDGQPVKDAYGLNPSDPDFAEKFEKCPDMTLGLAVSHALFASCEDERNLTGDAKWARGALADRIKDDEATELTAEEITVVKRLVGKLYNVAMVTWAMPLLDPVAKPGALS